ncbi:MAG: N-acetylmuramoyl-L-alanine amidase [Xanthomonadaceae bacterium]|jgi:N-acetylmuramoyl-L-alanine amidase|nr:N-acetylmuramoyl-L-alanine amidase [Xanthomonadaceae bacterium]
MNRQAIRFSLVSAGLALACLLSSAIPALAGEVQGITLDSGASGTHVEIRLQGSGSFNTLTLANPERLVIDLPQSTVKNGVSMPAGTGVVSSVRTGQPTPDTLRIVFDLTTAGASASIRPPRMENIGGTSRLIIEWPGDEPAATPATVASAQTATVDTAPRTVAAGSPADAEPLAARAGSAPSPLDILTGQSGPVAPISNAEREAAINALTSTGSGATAVPATAAPASAPGRRGSSIDMQSGMRALIVAIDAGHGGQDPGAIGANGRREKDVTLAVARELARQIDATPGLQAFLVRNNDVFIPLTERTARARRAKADIFVSIHADAAENRSATGSSVYVLSTRGASSQRARWLADKENSADLVGGVNLAQTENTLSSVLLDLAQSGHMRASEEAAGHVLGGLKRIGNNHRPNIERANFAVLRTADMPAMLVETAFISNPAEERRLGDPAFQRHLAGAVLDGVATYFTRQPPPGTLFAARARAAAAGDETAMIGGGSP